MHVLLERAQPFALEHLIAFYHEYPEAVRQGMVSHVHLLESAMRGSIRADAESSRRNTMDLIAQADSYLLSYLLVLGLSSASAETRGQAATTLRNLAWRLYESAVDYSEACTQLGRTAYHYREFARHLKQKRYLVGALRDALTAYDTHMRTSVLEASLVCALELDKPLLAESSKSHSKSWRALLEKLKHDPEPVAALFTLLGLGHADSRAAIARIVSECKDDPFMRAVMRQSWLLAEPAIAQGCQSIRKLAWLEQHQSALFEMTPRELRQTLRFVMHTQLSQREKVHLCKTVLLSDCREKQAAALNCLMSIPGEDASDVMRVVLDWSDAKLARIATRELIYRYPEEREALSLRMQTMGSETTQNRRRPKPATTSQPETFEDYWQQWDGLDENQRVQKGQAIVQEPDFVPSLRDKIQSTNPADRLKAILVIRTLRLAEFFKSEIFQSARDEDRMVRSAAVKTLSMLKSGMSEQLMITALDDPDRRVRANAVEALDESRSPQRLDKIRPKLADSDHRVRASAIKALMQLKVREAAETLLGELKSESRASRMSALWVIERLHLFSILERIVMLAEMDRDSVVRKRAKRLIRKAKRQSNVLWNVELPPSKGESQEKSK